MPSCESTWLNTPLSFKNCTPTLSYLERSEILYILLPLRKLIVVPKSPSPCISLMAVKKVDVSGNILPSRSSGFNVTTLLSCSCTQSLHNF